MTTGVCRIDVGYQLFDLGISLFRRIYTRLFLFLSSVFGELLKNDKALMCFRGYEEMILHLHAFLRCQLTNLHIWELSEEYRGS